MSNSEAHSSVNLNPLTSKWKDIHMKYPFALILALYNWKGQKSAVQLKKLASHGNRVSASNLESLLCLHLSCIFCSKCIYSPAVLILRWDCAGASASEEPRTDATTFSRSITRLNMAPHTKEMGV